MVSGRFLSDDAALRALLEGAGVRVTSQRLGLAQLLFSGEHRHVVASDLHLQAAHRGLSISLATVYNTLRQFVDAGLLHEVTVDTDSTWFDTNVAPHAHAYDETTGALNDVHLPEIPLPPGIAADQVVAVEVLFRVRSEPSAEGAPRAG